MTSRALAVERRGGMLLLALLVACAAGALFAPRALAGSALEPANGSTVATARPTFVVSVSATDRFPQIQIASQSGTGTLGFPLTSRLGICLPSPIPGRGSCSLPYDLQPGTYYWLLVYQSADGKIHLSGPLRFKVAGGAPP